MNTSFFSKKLYTWHASIERNMPWKETKDPYKIWLSEIIMQQTRVAQGWNYYLHFIENYPTVFDLAQASEDQVLKSWEGLGYYSRARNLHATSKMIVEKYKGVFPDTLEELLLLKGVGKYTASAIASFAFDKAHAVVDGNVIRVLSRIFGIQEPFDTTTGKKLFEELAQQKIDTKQAAKYNQAMMDFGAVHCKPMKPLCEECIFQKDCYAYSNNMIDLLPVKSKKIIIQKRYIEYFIFIDKKTKKVLLHKRGEQDIWKGLYEFVGMYSTKKISKKEKDAYLDTLQLKNKISIPDLKFSLSHPLTHQMLYIEAQSFYVNHFELAHYDWVHFNDLKTLAFPKPLQKNLYLVENFLK